MLWFVTTTLVGLAWKIPAFKESGAFNWWWLCGIVINMLSLWTFEYALAWARKTGGAK